MQGGFEIILSGYEVKWLVVVTKSNAIVNPFAIWAVAKLFELERVFIRRAELQQELAVAPDVMIASVLAKIRIKNNIERNFAVCRSQEMSGTDQNNEKRRWVWSSAVFNQKCWFSLLTD